MTSTTLVFGKTSNWKPKFGGIVLLIIILAITGCVKNFIKLTECDFESPYKCEAIHSIGLLPVFGVFTGWIDIDDTSSDK